MGEAITSNKEMEGKWFFKASFLLGAVAMVFAGYFLVIGLSKFGGDDTTRNILIMGGILFQIVESFCFVGAAGYAFHSRVWQITLFTLGCVLFVFSLFVMTLAQKTAMHTGEMQAGAIDSRVTLIEQQIASYDKLITSYEHNAEKQSNSIYKDSRQLGQDSLNKATSLEEKKMSLVNELFVLKNDRRQTSMDFFKQLGELTGYEATKLEWYFMIGRAVLFELIGIILLSFGVTLKAKYMKKHYEDDFSNEPDPTDDTVNNSPIFDTPPKDGLDIRERMKQISVKDQSVANVGLLSFNNNSDDTHPIKKSSLLDDDIVIIDDDVYTHSEKDVVPEGTISANIETVPGTVSSTKEIVPGTVSATAHSGS